MAAKLDSPNIVIQRPISALNKAIKFDGKGLFKALVKAAKDGFTGKWEDLAPDLADAAASLDLKTDPGALAWLLISRAFTRAVHGLLSPISYMLTPDEAQDGIGDVLDVALEASSLEVDRDFFRRTGDLRLIENVAALLGRWFRAYGLNQAQSDAVTRRLRSTFVFALNQEWRANAPQYAPLLNTAETPFSVAADRELAWNYYGAWLRQQVEESLFQEPFSISQVFVAPRAYYETRGAGAKDPAMGRCGPDDCEHYSKVVVWLDEYLREWLTKADREDALRVISGGPGSGKSCFAKMFAASQAEEGRRVLYLPLHLLDAKADFISEVGRALQGGGFFAYNPLSGDDGDDRLLLILDGLDELAMLGKIAENIAQAFVRAVDTAIGRRNQQELHLQVIITGRTVIVEENALEFRREGQLLHLMSYLERDTSRLVDNNKIAEIDQRQEWWCKYGLATGKNYDGMPTVLGRDDLVEVTAQPLLCLLVALSHERKQVDFSRGLNLNVVYADLLDAIYNRPWGNRRNYAIKGMNKDHFVRVLEEIGLAAWHGNGRSTTVFEIREHCDRAGLSRMMDIFKEGVEAGVARLLTAFYFRQSGVRNDQQTFEFTHKSFGEYLAARRIVGAIARLSLEYERHTREVDSGWDEKRALQYWVQTCGPSTLESNIVRFVHQEVALWGSGVVATWQQTICVLIPYMLRKGLPLEAEGLTYGEASRQARNAEEALLVALDACASRVNRISDIDWPEATSAGTWFRKLQGQRTGPEPCIALRSLRRLNLSGAHLHCLDLWGARLDGSNLSGIRGYYAILGGASFVGANLEGACLEGANLTRANFSSVRAEHADFESADLNKASLISANLAQAYLVDANFFEADLSGADLAGARIGGARLERANLKGANMERVDSGHATRAGRRRLAKPPSADEVA